MSNKNIKNEPGWLKNIRVATQDLHYHNVPIYAIESQSITAVGLHLIHVVH